MIEINKKSNKRINLKLVNTDHKWKLKIKMMKKMKTLMIGIQKKANLIKNKINKTLIKNNKITNKNKEKDQGVVVKTVKVVKAKKVLKIKKNKSIKKKVEVKTKKNKLLINYESSEEKINELLILIILN